MRLLKYTNKMVDINIVCAFYIFIQYCVNDIRLLM